MACVYPKPQDVGIPIPATLRPERFCAGFAHGLHGGQLDHVEYFRLSFRMGFRSAKLYLREVRRRHGIIEFPVHGRMRMRAVGLERG